MRPDDFKKAVITELIIVATQLIDYIIQNKMLMNSKYSKCISTMYYSCHYSISNVNMLDFTNTHKITQFIYLAVNI